jgi:hypothetical protein
MTDQDAGDASQVEVLLDQFDTPIGQFTADGAYDGNPTYVAVTRHSADAAVVIPPRANAVKQPGADPSSQRERHIAAIIADGRMKWQAATGYGKRSLVETAIGRYNQSSAVGYEHALSARSRRRSPSAAPSSIECWHAHARNPSSTDKLPRSQGIKDRDPLTFRSLHQRREERNLCRTRSRCTTASFTAP